MTNASTASIPQRSYRIDSIDLLRGLVMIIMALDHTRDNFHIGAYTGDPLNLETTTPFFFFTRWITHFCAPVFVFLSGTSIYLQGFRKSKSELSRFLFKRGLWLIVVEIVLISFAITADIQWGTIVLQVIWAIGISMVLLALLIRLPYTILLCLGALIVLGHNALDFYEKGNESVPVIIKVLHQPGMLPVSPTHAIGAFYPFLPWTGVMILGYCFGRIYQQQTDEAKRNRTITLIGVALIAFFVLLRFINVYGNPQPWAAQKNGLYTVLSFINVQKYPPSLLYLCMTVGVALVFLGSAGSAQNRFTKIITVYGRVPFFYYILHFYLLRLGTVVFFLARGHSFSEGISGIPKFPFYFIIPGQGVSLLMVYVIWLTLVVLLYPLCNWYGRFKKSHHYWWLSYV